MPEPRASAAAGTCGEGTGGQASVSRGIEDVPLSLAEVGAAHNWGEAPKLPREQLFWELWAKVNTSFKPMNAPGMRLTH